MNFSEYILHLLEAIEASNGPNLAYYLRPTSPHAKDLVKEFRNPTVRICVAYPIPTSLTILASESHFLSMKGVWRVLGTRSPSSMFWFLLMQQRNVQER